MVSLMARGVTVAGEFRYLEPTDSGAGGELHAIGQTAQRRPLGCDGEPDRQSLERIGNVAYTLNRTVSDELWDDFSTVDVAMPLHASNVGPAQATPYRTFRSGKPCSPAVR